VQFRAMVPMEEMVEILRMVKMVVIFPGRENSLGMEMKMDSPDNLALTATGMGSMETMQLKVMGMVMAMVKYQKMLPNMLHSL